MFFLSVQKKRGRRTNSEPIVISAAALKPKSGVKIRLVIRLKLAVSTKAGMSERWSPAAISTYCTSPLT